MSDIVLNATTYVGEGIQNGVTNFINRSAELLSGFSSLVGRVRNQNKRVEVRWNLAVPVLVADDSPCGCAGEVRFITYAEVSVKFDQRADLAHRTDVYERLVDLLAATQVGSSIKNLQPPV